MILRAESVSRVLPGDVPVQLLRDVTLEIDSGQFVIINGPSGSGKSSLLYLLGLLDAPSSGDLWFNGQNTAHFNEQQRAQIRLAEIGFVFQFHFLLPEFTALRNVMLPMQRLGRLGSQEIRQRAVALLEQVGLGEHLHKRPKQLSGGQSQRVALARALANEPLLILADEPTGNLDSAASDAVRDILIGLTRDSGRTVVTVTHDEQFAREPDRLITIVDGAITD